MELTNYQIEQFNRLIKYQRLYSSKHIRVQTEIHHKMDCLYVGVSYEHKKMDLKFDYYIYSDSTSISTIVHHSNNNKKYKHGIRSTYRDYWYEEGKFIKTIKKVW